MYNVNIETLRLVMANKKTIVKLITNNIDTDEVLCFRRP